FNSVSFAREEVVVAPDGSTVFVACPPYGTGEIARPLDRVTVNDGDEIALENGQLRAVLSRGGDLVSLVEKTAGLEVLAAPGNRLELHDDRPVEEDAWEVDPFHLETGRQCEPAATFDVVQSGPLAAEIVFERGIGLASTLRQTVRLAAHGRRLEFHT